VRIIILKLWRNPLHFIGYLIAAVVVCSYLFFSPQNLPQNIPNSDKIGHIIVFFTLSLLLFKATNWRRPIQILALLGYGVLVECIQHFIPYRSGGIDDVVADAAGIVLFYLLTLIPAIRKKMSNNIA